MSRIQKLIDERATTWHRMQEIRQATEAEDRDFTAEERTNFDAADARLVELGHDIERLERSDKLESVDRNQVVEAREAAPSQDVNEEERYERAFSQMIRRGESSLSAEDRTLMQSRFDVRGTAAQGTTSGAVGGYTIPPGFLVRMTEAMKAFGGILGQAEVINTESGNPLQWPTFDGTLAKGAILAENTQEVVQDMAFGTKTLGAYTYSSQIVKASLQVLQDSAFDLDGFVATKLGQRLGRIVADHLATGTGSSQPDGLFHTPTTGVTGGTLATPGITYDNIVDLIHSVDPAYRASNCQFVLNDATLAAIRKLKDSYNRPLWEPSVQAGVPSNLLGYGYTVDQGVPDIAAGAFSVGFGDVRSAYLVRQVSGGQLLRLTERYADFLQVGYLGFMRLDAVKNDVAAFKAFKHGPVS